MTGDPVGDRAQRCRVGEGGHGRQHVGATDGLRRIGPRL
jgi:hypothetical protein